MSEIKSRSEILFLYDVKLCNPNGDPMDSNRPRIDEETEKCLVTDVRLKRTVRDYFLEIGYDGQTDKMKDIFVRDAWDGSVLDLATRADAEKHNGYNTKEEFLAKYLDARLFGAVSAPKKKKAASGNKKKNKDQDESTEEEGSEEAGTDPVKTFHLTGPVQFGMGKSLHVVRENLIQGTGAFSTGENKDQYTFREDHNIAYGLIAFHGIINENAAKHSKCTEEDVALLMEGLWQGTRNLLTRSKKGHEPRLLVKIDYKPEAKGFFIGELPERLSLLLNEDKTDKTIDDIADFKIDTTELNRVLQENKGKIAKITVRQADRIFLSENIFTIES